jgi:AraC family transcriptional regulator of adaptative response/methylated-DNA-[protein]-cysteine methyltransferase
MSTAKPTKAGQSKNGQPNADTRARQYHTIARAIDFINAEQQNQPGLKDIAAAVDLSEFHLQRLFSDWAGVSPKQYLQFLTKEHAKRCLREHSVLDAALESGLSGPGRLHDLLIQTEGMTPGEYRKLGAGLTLRYGFAPCPLGICAIASTERGICKLSFLDSLDDQDAFYDELAAEWPQATLLEDAQQTQAMAQTIFDSTPGQQQPIRVVLKGSPFQLQVWEALLRIPEGELVSYGDCAALLGRPEASRAVASAIAKNPVGLLIPCHRVIRNNGEFSQYRWGATRKKALIAREQSLSALGA